MEARDNYLFAPSLGVRTSRDVIRLCSQARSHFEESLKVHLCHTGFRIFFQKDFIIHQSHVLGLTLGRESLCCVVIIKHHTDLSQASHNLYSHCCEHETS
jgi:hypothetical protein